jgi:hypothetical protein
MVWLSGSTLDSILRTVIYGYTIRILIAMNDVILVYYVVEPYLAYLGVHYDPSILSTEVATSP